MQNFSIAVNIEFKNYEHIKCLINDFLVLCKEKI